MKKTFYTLIPVLAFVLLLSGCKKFNDQFDGLDAKTVPTNLTSYTYTLVDADYTAIATAANKVANDSITYFNNKLKTAPASDTAAINAAIKRIKTDPAYLNAVYVGANKFFNSTLQAKNYVPYLLNTAYIFADKGSVMNATYNVVDSGDTSVLTATDKFTLTADDYNLMGVGVNQPGQYDNMSNVMPVLSYLNTFLKLKCPYAVANDIKMVTYMYYDSNKTTKKQYRVLVFDGLSWKAASEQYNFVGTGWMYDPTVKITMAKSDYQIMVDYVLATPAIAVFAHPYYKNEEYYWGFASRYSNTSFRLSYRNPYFTGTYVQPATIDPELNGLATTEAKVALMWTRLKKGMEIFCQLRFPQAVPNVSGINVFYKVKTLVYYPLGTGGASENHEYVFQCMSAATGGNPPTFKFISESKVN